MSSKILFLHIFQPFAQFRNPFTVQYALTFPLPPPSTIIGMLQNLTGRYYSQEFRKLQFSIHGASAAVFWNYQRLISTEEISLGFYSGKITPLAKDNSFGTKYLPVYYAPPAFRPNAFPTPQQELFNSHFFIFIRGPEDLLEEIAEALNNPKKVVYLGRAEDIAYFRDAGFLIRNQEGGYRYDPLIEKSIASSSWRIEENENIRSSVHYFMPTYIDAEQIMDCCEELLPKIFAQSFYLPVYSEFVIEENREKRPIKHKGEMIFDKIERNVVFKHVKYLVKHQDLVLPENKEKQKFKVLRIKFSLSGIDIKLKLLEPWGWLDGGK